ncbi:unnamed protein product [Hymenolepis diminuta]|uniref:Ovule protein n=1 Tax=Hymenolepis diminuta TaxID=6216 RepID=A0A0R3S8I4_HYMDI|nr:unnamed protein product [Hymenolepis diminuta]
MLINNRTSTIGRNFDEVALNFLIRALCCLATESSEVANSSRDPSHFSTVKLAEVGLANLHRLDIWWKTINDQLLSIIFSSLVFKLYSRQFLLSLLSALIYTV